MHLGYEGHDYKSGDNFGDSRNGKTVRTITTSFGPITVNVPEGTGTAPPERRGGEIQKENRDSQLDHPEAVFRGAQRRGDEAHHRVDIRRQRVEIIYIKRDRRGHGRRSAIRRNAGAAEGILPIFGLDVRPVEAGGGPEGGDQHRDGRRRRRPKGDTRLFDNARGVIRSLRRASPVVQEPEPPRGQAPEIHEQPDRKLQQADKKRAQEANLVRDRRGSGEKNRHHVPAFQQGVDTRKVRG